uniref:Uncharacterized protein n=1 Tax=Mucochytrium quahogii TaxID=96639 RepID=A0A7S2S3Y2_9STRA|mmetsp:Transcript_20039/g.33085  ORF Transcript_20039/g.33085 Transcript_20039/m.33085 type:complete len:291 (+) Transcript_20039:3398-4270(+)
MGTLKGHLIPGAEFMLLSLFLNFIHKADQLRTKERQEVQANYRNVETEPLTDVEENKVPIERPMGIDVEHSTNKIKLFFSIFVLTSVVVGMLYEGIGAVLYKSGSFFEEKGHLVMYFGFLPVAIAYGLESGLFPGSKPVHVRTAPLLSMTAFALAFFNQWQLLSSHTAMKKPGPDMAFHGLWTSTALMLWVLHIVAVLAKLANFDSMARIILLLSPAAFCLQGLWTCLIGIIMFPVYGEMHDDMEMETIHALFGLCLVLVCCLQYIWVELVPAEISLFYLPRSVVPQANF